MSSITEIILKKDLEYKLNKKEKGEFYWKACKGNLPWSDIWFGRRCSFHWCESGYW